MRLTARGDADPDEVWDRYVRPQRWPEWSPQIRSVDTPADRLTPGMQGRVRGPLGLYAAFTVVDVDEAARSWSWQVHIGPAHLRLHHLVAARAPGTCTELDIHGPWPVVLAYAPLAQLALGRLVRA